MTLTKPLDRRTFLRASGVALGLPLLESMAPALARAATVEAPRRIVTICSTLGLFSSSWFPQTAGAGYEATEYLRSSTGTVRGTRCSPASRTRSRAAASRTTPRSRG